MKIVCLSCPRGCNLTIINENNNITVKGNRCPLGIKFGKQEITEPKRMLTTTIKVKNSNILVPVKTSDVIPKNKIKNVIEIINKKDISLPVKMGDILIENILNLNVNIVATRSII